MAGEPLEHVVGWVAFAGLRLSVGPGVFVPRRRTELLARQSLSALGGAHPGTGSQVLIELCCGVGPVLAAAAVARPGLELYGVEVDETASAHARRNAPRAHILTGDLFDPLPATLAGRVDVIAVNAPYVPTTQIPLMPPEARHHEPRRALDGGPDGLSFHRRLAAEAASWLSPTGVLLIETSRGLASATAAELTDHGLIADLLTDDDLDATVVRGRVDH